MHAQTHPDHTALNILENAFYVHHLFIRAVSRETVPFEKDSLVEVNNLKVPATLNGRKFWLMEKREGLLFISRPFFSIVCRLGSFSKFKIKSFRLSATFSSNRWRIFQACLSCRQRSMRKTNILSDEMGARWGSWGAGAIVFLRKVNPLHTISNVSIRRLWTAKGFERSWRRITYMMTYCVTVPEGMMSLMHGSEPFWKESTEFLYSWRWEGHFGE